uniref:Uncharacterized protein n=1 Tax=viral metagenome TaxID=1070528 RepID=A0A6C0KH72_9ZZZZ
MASITLDYVLFIKQFIVAQAIRIWNQQDVKPQLQAWNEIFNELHIPLQYLYQLIYHSHTISSTQSTYSLENMHDLVTKMYNAPRTYVEQSFQEYIDERVNLQKVGPYDYQAFIKNMTDPTFKQNIYAKYQKDFELMALKNLIIQECEAQENPDNYLNTIPYLEYVSMKNHSNQPNIKQTYILELEKQTHEIINQQIR